MGFSEKLVYLPHSYQANDYNVSHNFCGGGEGLRKCQASARQAPLKDGKSMLFMLCGATEGWLDEKGIRRTLHRHADSLVIFLLRGL